MRKIWKAAKVAILLTLCNYSKTSEKWTILALNLEIPTTTQEKLLWRRNRFVLFKEQLEKSLRIWHMNSDKNGHFAKGSSNLFENHLFCWGGLGWLSWRSARFFKRPTNYGWLVILIRFIWSGVESNLFLLTRRYWFHKKSFLDLRMSRKKKRNVHVDQVRPSKRM